jgi:hypothetical protein
VAPAPTAPVPNLMIEIGGLFKISQFLSNLSQCTIKTIKNLKYQKKNCQKHYFKGIVSRDFGVLFHFIGSMKMKIYFFLL